MKISQVLDKRRATKSGFPVKIRVSYDSKADLFPIPDLYLTEAAFETQTESVSKRITAYEGRVRKIVRELSSYSAEAVRISLAIPDRSDDSPLVNDISVWFKYKAAECISVRDSLGNAQEYDNARKFYQKYFGRECIPFEMVTESVLFHIQKTMGVNHSISTIGKYARHLRAVFNLAIDRKFISRDLYPFGKYHYVPPVSRKRKHALSKEALQLLLSYEPGTVKEQLYLDLFFFSFYGNGLNLKDVATLRYRDMSKYHIIKRREKTKNNGVQEPIKIYLMQEIIDIIDRQGNKDRSLDNYIFPLLDKEWDSQQIFDELKKLRSAISRTLSSIGKVLGIEGRIPHGTSRHCFANALKQAGAPTELISETIGHSSVAVTKHYTSDFEEAGITYQAYLLKYTGK